jgi:prophage regulatory protein
MNAQADMQAWMPDPIVRRRGLKAATGLSPATIYRMMNEGSFPRPVRLGKQAVGWPSSMIRAWLQSRPTADIG